MWQMKIRLILMLGILTMLFTACSGEGAKTSPELSASATNNILDEPVTLTFYREDTLEQFMTDYGVLIQKRFPNYKVQYVRNQKGSTIADLIAAGSMNIDIIITSIGETYNQLLDYDLQSDISDLVKKYKFDLNRLEPASIGIQNQLANGGIYGLPFSTSTTVLYYNKDLFDKFAQPYPKDGMTWDDLYELTKKMSRTQDGIQYRGLTMAYTHMLRLNQSSVPIVDSKTNKSTYSTDKFKKEFTNLARFYQIPGNGLPGETYVQAAQVDLFSKDQTAAMSLHLSRAGVTIYQDHLNWDVVRQPYFNDMPGVGPQSYPYYFYITKTSQHRDAAFQVLAYITSDEFQQHIMRQGYNTILKDPSRLLKDLGTDLPFLKNKHVEAFIPEKGYAPPTLYSKYQTVAEKEENTALSDVVVQGVDVNSALRSATERADKAIEAQIAKAGK